MLTENIHTANVAKVSDEHRIDLIRTLRNELAKLFLEEKNLRAYFKKHFKQELTAIQLEFIKKELQELLIAPVDLVQYASLLIEMKQSGSASLAIKNEDLFYNELDAIFKKYVH